MKRFVTLLILSAFLLGLSAKDFVIKRGADVKLILPEGIKPVAVTAADMLASDMGKVLGSKMVIVQKGGAEIICEIDATLPHEGFVLIVNNGKLHITGADSHGLAYGILEVSRLLGVSPWEYWADCTPHTLSEFQLPDGYSNVQHPAVAYRGIFINDEDWGLNPWATKQEPEAFTLKQGRIKGAIGPKVNEKIFQLLLRLRANYYWPAMHECSQPFYTIEGNREVAKKYGIYLGGSHCEPMATSPAAEWGIRGKGDYNYVTNRPAVQDFWRERIDEVKDQEVVYTLGMRGVHDGAMQGVKTNEDKLKYLQMVINDQRNMLKYRLGITQDALTKIPQVFVPYKEVLDIYKSGLQVPDDVTLMWTDDNYGYIRHYPDSVELARKGGNGLYYHISYWGRPHDYLWLNSMPPQVITNELMEGYRRGIQKMWVVNVGDIKPSEYQTELFMDIAWKGISEDDWYEKFFVREFGDDLGKKVASLMQKHFELMNQCKPEFMGGTRTEEADKTYWNTIHKANEDWTLADVDARIKAYESLSDEVEKLSSEVPLDRKDAFFEMVKYPVQGAAQMTFKFLCPERCETAYDSIQSLTHIYNKVCADGKWDGIMSASPRNLSVFGKVSASQLPVYPEKSEWQLVATSNGGEISTPMEFTCKTQSGAKIVTLQFRLFPNHPINSDRLAFSVSVDGNAPKVIEYQTYDRSEEWKQNVLRGYAKRIITLPSDDSRTEHRILLTPLTNGVKLKSVWMK